MKSKKLGAFPALVSAAQLLVLDPVLAKTPPPTDKFGMEFNDGLTAEKPQKNDWVRVSVEFGTARRHFTAETKSVYDLVEYRIALETKHNPGRTRAEYIRRIIERENKKVKRNGFETQKEIILALQEITVETRKLLDALGTDNFRAKLIHDADFRAQTDAVTKKIKILWGFSPYESLRKYEFLDISNAFQRWVLEHELEKTNQKQQK